MAMTVQEIIDEVAERHPNSLTTASLVRKLNNIEAELFRTIYKKKTFTSYDIVGGLAYYPMDFDISKVINVLVDGEEYDWEENNDKEAEEPYAYAYENSVVLAPTPDVNSTAGLLIWHFQEPTELTTSALTAIPDFDGDFHMILVWLLSKDIAEIDGKDDRATYFQSKADELIKKFEESNPEPELAPIGVS